jgi:hypothetical protein
MTHRLNTMAIAGWALTLAVTLFMLRDLSPDLQRAPWAIAANAGIGIPGDVVLLVGLAGLVCTLAYLVPATSMLGAILLTGFLGGAVFTHVRIHGDASDIADNVVIGVLAWGGLWLRDARLRQLLPIRRAVSKS